MNRKEYNKACAYARKLTKTSRDMDIVHDAYLDHFLRTGLDLFDCENKTMIATIKNHYYNSIRSKKFMYDGEFYWKKNYSFDAPSLFQEGAQNHDYIQSKFNVCITDGILDSIILNDMVGTIGESLTERQKYVLYRLVDGYTVKDISDEEGVNQSSVRKTLGYIQEEAIRLSIRK